VHALRAYELIKGITSSATDVMSTSGYSHFSSRTLCLTPDGLREGKYTRLATYIGHVSMRQDTARVTPKSDPPVFVASLFWKSRDIRQLSRISIRPHVPELPSDPTISFVAILSKRLNANSITHTLNPEPASSSGNLPASR
jgi:hypothetical protein